MPFEAIKGLGPQFFDVFGVLAFVYIIFFSNMLLDGKKLPKGFTVILLLIGLIGFFIDLIFASSFLRELS